MEAATTGSPLRAGELEIRPAELTAMAGDRPLRLTMRELDLLTALVEREGRIVSREELYRTVWGRALPQVRPLGGRLRGQAAPQARGRLPGRRFIHTHFGFGYRFQP